MADELAWAHPLPITLPHPTPFTTTTAAHPSPPLLQAKERYAEMADTLGLGGSTPEEKVIKLIEAVEGLKAQCGVPVSSSGGCCGPMVVSGRGGGLFEAAGPPLDHNGMNSNPVLQSEGLGGLGCVAGHLPAWV